MTARKKTADAQPAADETPDVQLDENPDELDEQTRPVETVDFIDRDYVRDPSEVDAHGKTEQEVRDELMGADPVDISRHSFAEPPAAPVDSTPPAAAYVDEPDKAVTMADVASLNGIGLAPDGSLRGTVKASEVPFISEGMRNDLEIQGFTLDPTTGRKIVRDDLAKDEA